MKRKLLIMMLSALSAVSMAIFASCNGCSGCKGCNGGDVEEPSEYTVTFVENGGTEVADLILTAGDDIPVPPDPQKEYFTFEYWCGDSALTSRYTFGVMPAQDIVLYAKWTPQRAVRISFESNGGTPVDDVIATAGGAVTAPKEPTREGYSFAGWYKDEGLTEYFAFDAAPTENITLYARWMIQQGNYLVSFVVNGTTVSSLSVKGGQTVSAPEQDEALVFDGWYKNEACTEPFDFSSAISANISLYAVAYTSGLSFDGNAVTGYTGEHPSVVIPSQYLGVTVTEVSERAFYKNEAVTDVSLPETVERIGGYAFYGCSYLKAINLTESVKSIGEYAFCNDVRLEEIGEITGVTTIEAGTFLGCKEIEAFSLSDSLQRVKEYAFSGCSSLGEMTLPDAVSSIGDYAFSGCLLLGAFTIPRNLVTLGAGVFDDCSDLSQMTVAAGNTKFSIADRNLYTDMQRTLVMYLQADKTDTSFTTRNETKIMEGAFAGKNLLKSITIGRTVTEIERGALKNMEGLEELTIPFLGDGKDNLYLAYIFGAASAQINGMTGKYVPQSLKKVTISRSLNAVPEYAFYGCNGLEEIIGIENATSYGSYAFSYTAIKAFDVPASVTSIGQDSSGASAFSGCYSLESVTVAQGNAKFASYDGSIYDKDLTTLYYVPSAKTEISFAPTISKIESYVFSYSNIAEIEVPESVEEIGFRALYNANKLSYLKLPFIGGSRNENRYLLYLFGGSITTAEGKSTVKNSDLVPASLETVEYYGRDNIPDFAFVYCEGLKNVIYGDAITEIGSYAFAYTGLEKVAIGGGVTKLGNYAFAHNSSLTGEIVVPGRITEMGMGCFGYNRNVTAVTIEEGVKEISYGAFISYAETNTSTGETYYYSSLTQISIPASVTLIDGLAFDGAGRTYNSTLAAHVMYPVTVNIAAGSKLKEIGYGAFAESGIQSIVLPATLEYLGGQVRYDDEGEEERRGSVFLSCSALTSVTIGSAEEGSNLKAIGSLSFAYCTRLNSLTIYKNVESDDDVPTFETEPLTTGARADIFYNGALPAIYVTGAEVYKENEMWSAYSRNIYEIRE